MLKFMARRLLQAVPLVIGVSIIAFSLMHLAPGGPLAVYTLNPTIQAQDIERIKVALGLDQPLHIQYLKWAYGMFTGTWGHTFFGGRPVLDVILERVPATMVLMGTSLAFAVLIGTAIGMAAYGLRLPAELTPGPYRLIGGLYDPGAPGAPRILTAAGADHVELAIVTVTTE